ncbi:MAG TPA: DUF177 domain-containing protein [Gemmatimonadales bacterium]|nr:DUF177 domain-containing protein [Gemmatimonadales bacterium]
MLQVDLNDLARGPVETPGEIAGDDPALAGMNLRLAAPVRVTGRLQEAGEGRFYWQGSLRAVVTGECRRCLTPVTAPVTADIGALFSQESDASDDPDAFPVAPDASVIDVTPAVREELALVAPEFLLCREDCRGLCPRCGHDLNTGPCTCPPVTDPRWAGLAGLKDKLSR